LNGFHISEFGVISKMTLPAKHCAVLDSPGFSRTQFKEEKLQLLFFRRCHETHEWRKGSKGTPALHKLCSDPGKLRRQRSGFRWPPAQVQTAHLQEAL
jgi:hypothetical protein